ncbi:hypothetical protein BDY21DRAFT_390389 [Lineolata rhizophorae]|uniref:RRM domain-containing protein n=1 Tax=Lineolata rhizophorae TaxID=578093 RepID=A0A6A6P1P5_9PEZI|nr:hypothetical protein BDY21DRAFT_390389 [Lineolata rhizophorae]
MANKKDAGMSFDSFLKAGRQRKKNEALAEEIFGRGANRRSSAPGAGRAMGTNKLLAAHHAAVAGAGVTKRPSSTGLRSSLNAPDRPRAHQLSRTASSSHLDRANSSRLFASLANPAISNVRSDPPSSGIPTGPAGANGRSAGVASKQEGINIKGAATPASRGPVVVIASNFAMGTTAADIEAVMLPVGGEMESCRLVSSSPTVIAEMVFKDREGAENVVGMFNNKMADGRLLYVYIKDAPAHRFNNPTASSSFGQPSNTPPPSAPSQPRNHRSNPPTGPRADRDRGNQYHDRDVAVEGEEAMMDVEQSGEASARRAPAEWQDGSYGFRENGGFSGRRGGSGMGRRGGGWGGGALERVRCSMLTERSDMVMAALVAKRVH